MAQPGERGWQAVSEAPGAPWGRSGRRGFGKGARHWRRSGEWGLEGPAQSHCKHTPLTQDSDHVRRSSVRKQTKSYVKTKNRYSSNDSQWAPSAVTSCALRASPQTDRPPYSGPQVKPQVLLDC